MKNLLRGQAKVLLSRDHTNSVGVAHTATPSLNTDDRVALVDDAELETVVDTPLEAAVDVLLPDLDVEVGLALGEVERPDTTVKVRVLSMSVVSCGLSELRRTTALTREAVALRVTMMMGQTGRYLDRRRAVLPLVVRTTMAPAFSSRLALTAAMAMDSEVSVGRGAKLRSSSKIWK